jgi:hypothetical protein
MTPEEWLEANLPRSENLPPATLQQNGAVISRGKAHLDKERKRGVFWSTDGAKPDLPIDEASLTVAGERISVEDVQKCSAPLSDHWHFSISDQS